LFGSSKRSLFNAHTNLERECDYS